MENPDLKTQLKTYLGGCIRTGRIKLASGKISDFYIDGRVATLDSKGLGLISCIFYDMLKGDDLDAVGGMTLGADPIVAGILTRSFEEGDGSDRALKGFLVRKEPKAHGTGRQIEGPELPPKARVALVDDVATSGGSFLKTLDVIASETEWQVVRVLCIVDREEGAAEALAARGYSLDAIFKKSDLV